MRRAWAFAVYLTVVASAILIAATPAAAARRVVWVDARVNGAWPVARAVSMVDNHTGSVLRLGRCRHGGQCIVIRESRSLPRRWAGATYLGAPTRILLNPSRRWHPYAQRLHTLLHELGHARGLYGHTARCTSVMYHAMHCPNGRVAPNTFTAAERLTLRRN